MAGRFMKVKRIIIPFITLVIMTSQLAGCATMNSDEMLKSMQESPDVSIEYAIPDGEQQSLDATQVIDAGDQQYVSDSDSEGDIGVIDNRQEAKELSGTELLEYFQIVYDICQEIHISTTLDGLINEELEFLQGLTESDGYTLPSDYEAQYRAWRPTDSLPADIQNQQEQQVNSTQQSTEQTQTQKPSTVQTQTQKPSSDTQQNQNQSTQKPSSSNQTQQPQPSQPSSGPDIYRGYGSYEAMIDAICKKYPDFSREEVMSRNPDLAGLHVNKEAAADDAAKGLLNMGG